MAPRAENVSIGVAIAASCAAAAARCRRSASPWPCLRCASATSRCQSRWLAWKAPRRSDTENATRGTAQSYYLFAPRSLRCDGGGQKGRRGAQSQTSSTSGPSPTEPLTALRARNPVLQSRGGVRAYTATASQTDSEIRSRLAATRAARPARLLKSLRVLAEALDGIEQTSRCPHQTSVADVSDVSCAARINAALSSTKFST